MADSALPPKLFNGQMRRKPVTNVALFMILGYMKIEAMLAHGFRSSLRD